MTEPHDEAREALERLIAGNDDSQAFRAQVVRPIADRIRAAGWTPPWHRVGNSLISDGLDPTVLQEPPPLPCSQQTGDVREAARMVEKALRADSWVECLTVLHLLSDAIRALPAPDVTEPLVIDHQRKRAYPAGYTEYVPASRLEVTEERVERAMDVLFGKYDERTNCHAWISPSWSSARVKVRAALTAALHLEEAELGEHGHSVQNMIAVVRRWEDSL